ncbi:ABC transporter permease [Treponema primitia]|uniref:ABC transporter permease n=1 Tax=Treponema primitia TaxID=88058 RepID=UPI00397F84C6
MNIKYRKWMKEYGLIIIFFFVVVILSIASPVFRLPRNLLNVVKQASVNGILAIGMMVVIISGGIDLSMGSVVGFAGVCAALCGHPEQFPLIVPVLAALAAGCLIGLLNGIGVAYGDLPPFIITLGTMSIARGLALIFSKGIPVIKLSPEFQAISTGTLFSIPYLSFYLILIVVAIGFVMNNTIFGRHTYSIGGNKEAAMVAGINVKSTLVAVYTLAGALAGVGGILMASRTNQGAPTMGVSYEMDAVTGVVIGGVSMSGGVGKWYGVLIGALFMAVIENGLTIFGVDPNWKQVVKGTIIIIAVLIDVKSKGRQN